jgi:Ala-tRNA(Pro) deacylase
MNAGLAARPAISPRSRFNSPHSGVACRMHRLFPSKGAFLMTLDRCFPALERNQIPFSHSVHSPAWTARDVARAERMPAHSLAKVVVYHADHGYGMLLLPADSAVDFGEVLRLLGFHQIRLANEVELGRLFPDCELGAMPPFANLIEMPVLIDESLASSEYVGFNAGTHRDVIHMSFTDLVALINPLIASFAVPLAAAAAR